MAVVNASLKEYVSSQFWIRKRAGVVLAFTFASTIFVLILGTVDDASMLLVAAVPLILGLIVYVFWYLSRQFYWRQGNGYRVAVSGSGFRIPEDEISKTRELLAKHGSSHKGAVRIRIKVVPSELAENEEDRMKLISKYGFATVAVFVLNEPLEPNALKTLDWKFTTPRTQTQKQQFYDTHKNHVHRLLQSGTAESHYRALVSIADSMYDGVLVNVGVLLFTLGKFQDAAHVLRELDTRLEAKGNSSSEFPRIGLRQLELISLLSFSRFGAGESPGTEQIESAIENCAVAAERFGLSHSWVYAAWARVLFFKGDLAGARSIAQQIAQCADAERAKRILLIDMAFLDLLDNKFEEAAKGYTELFARPDDGHLVWSDLVEFADHALEMGYENAVYAKALYRSFLAKEKMDSGVLNAAREWLRPKQSAKCLATVLERQVYSHERSWNLNHKLGSATSGLST